MRTQENLHCWQAQLAHEVDFRIANRCSIALEVGVLESPPSAVQRNSRGICPPTRWAVSITSSSGMTGSTSANAMFAQASALLAAITFLPRHGTSTRAATGSQTKPIMLWNAIEAAATDCVNVPPAIFTSAAAAMHAAEPPSA